jgi:hypothetical protein
MKGELVGVATQDTDRAVGQTDAAIIGRRSGRVGTVERVAAAAHGADALEQALYGVLYTATGPRELMNSRAFVPRCGTCVGRSRQPASSVQDGDASPARCR